MMAIANVIGLSSGKRLLSSTYHYSDFPEKFGLCVNADNQQNGLASSSTKTIINAKKSIGVVSIKPVNSAKEHMDVVPTDSTLAQWLIHGSSRLSNETSCPECGEVDVLILLQKLMLEKQWNAKNGAWKRIQVTCSGTSARNRRMNYRRRVVSREKGGTYQTNESKEWKSVISQDVVQNRFKGYGKGVLSEELLTHAEVVRLSEKIKVGLLLDERKSRLKESLGSEPSDEQLASSLRITRPNLRSKLIESSLAREKLAMRNVRLVMSIAKRYDNKGAEMADLVQGGLIGLLRGIEKFDSSKGFKISTYVYWWIRQGISKVLVENSRTLRLPTHLHERLILIRNAKIRLEKEGIDPSVDASLLLYLKPSKWNILVRKFNLHYFVLKKVRNATEAVSRVFSLDREAFPSVNGLLGETLHCYIADTREENIPWHGVDEWTLKDEVNKLMCTTLRERERDIIRLYYGLDTECHTWEDISRRIGLSRERVRQVGLVALGKLKHAARRKRLEAMLIKH